MNLKELPIWVAAALAVNLLVLAVFGAHWQFAALSSVVIIILFTVRQVFFTGIMRDYGRELQGRFGPVEASLFGLEWLQQVSDKQGKRCSMYVFPKHVVFVTPDPADEKQAQILEIELSKIEQVKLSREGHIGINVNDGKYTRRLFLKSLMPYDNIVRSLETLQSEIIHERKAQAMQKVSDKARQLNEQLRKNLEERRRIRVERLQDEGQELVKRFAGIVPEDIFIKDSLFEKCKELIKLEFRSRKSTVPGRLEGFLDNDFKPFAQIMRDKAGFDFEDEEDLIILLQSVREFVWAATLKSFSDQYSYAFDRVTGNEENNLDQYIDIYIRLCGPEVKELKNLEGFRQLLEKRGYKNSLKDLERKIESCQEKLSQELKKHDLEKKINSGNPVFDDVGDVDILGEVEFAEFIKSLVTKPGDDVEDIIFLDNSGIEMVFNAGQKVIVHALKSTNSVGAGDITQLAQAKAAQAADVGLFITNSLLTNSAIETAEQAGIIVWDRARLLDEIRESNLPR